MLLCVHIYNAARHLIEANRVVYDKEYDCIWIDEGSKNYDPWICGDHSDNGKGIYIDRATVDCYQIKVKKLYDTDRWGSIPIDVISETVSDVYNRMEKELFDHNKVYIEMCER